MVGVGDEHQVDRSRGQPRVGLRPEDVVDVGQTVLRDGRGGPIQSRSTCLSEVQMRI